MVKKDIEDAKPRLIIPKDIELDFITWSRPTESSVSIHVCNKYKGNRFIKKELESILNTYNFHAGNLDEGFYLHFISKVFC
jgi:hypothetical protein